VAGSDKGVFRVSENQLYDFRAGRIKHIFGTNFGFSDGLKSPSINGDGKPNVTRTHDSKLWWSLDQGGGVVDPNNLVRHNRPGPTIIESVVADDRTINQKNLTLPAGTHRLTIEYTSLTYAGADKVQFRYRLDGIDRDWFAAGRRREATFTNFGSGSHCRFRVQTSGDGGATWNEPGAEIAFYVRPFFYEEWWFLAGCVATVIAFIWLAFVSRRRSLEAHFRAVIVERVRVAGEIHDSLAQGFASAAMLLDSIDRKLPLDSALQQCIDATPLSTPRARQFLGKKRR
jgi:Y_Y_Y domain/Histidine kinase